MPRPGSTVAERNSGLLPSPVFKRVNVTTGCPPISGCLLSLLGADCAEEVIVITRIAVRVNGKVRNAWMCMVTPRSRRMSKIRKENLSLCISCSLSGDPAQLGQDVAQCRSLCRARAEREIGLAVQRE